MSIINDALKKVQSSLNSAEKKAPEAAPINNTNPAPTTTPTTGSQEQIVSSAVAKTSKSKESKLVYILGAICLLIALFAPIVNKQSVFGLIVSKISIAKKAKPAVAPVHHPIVNTPAKKSMATQAVEIKEEISRTITNMTSQPKTNSSVTKSSQRVTLNGIMAQGKKNVALIDGQIYEVGETVDGVKIIQINPNNIVIEENGTQRTIKVTGQ